MIFLFGVIGGPDVMDGPLLLRLLADLGVSEPAARSGLDRLVRSGAIGKRKQGRVAQFSLSATLRTSLGRSLHRQHEDGQAGPEWEGVFHTVLFRIPERSRSYRDALRYSARAVGYARLADGVLICPWDRWDELGRLPDRAPPGSLVTRATLELSLQDARRVCTEAWDLSERAEELRAQSASIEAALAEVSVPPATGETLHTFADLTLPGFAALAIDPGLPPELLPQDWPLTGLIDALQRANDRFGEPVDAYLRGFMT